MSAALPAQIIPKQHTPLPLPQGTGACTVGKSCAEIAPKLIEIALGPSPLERNLHGLNGAKSDEMAVQWAVRAFREAGAATVTAERLGSATVSGKPQNVVAEMPGRKLPNEYVLAGAELPAGSFGDRAGQRLADCTAAMLVDAARVLHSAGAAPRRSIRWVFFADERAKMAGSWAYAQQHRQELARTVAAVMFTPGCGAIQGYTLNGRTDALASARSTLQPLSAVGAASFTAGIGDAFSGALDFLLEGIPTLSPIQAEANSRPADLHNEREDMHISALKLRTAAAAIAVYGLADAPEPMAPRQTRAQIQQLLERMGLAARMRSAGTWKQWRTGQRGRAR